MSSTSDKFNTLTPELATMLKDALKLHKRLKAAASTCGKSVAELTATAFSYEWDDMSIMKSLAWLREELVVANKSMSSETKRWSELATGISGERLINCLVEHARVIGRKDGLHIGRKES
ncbi:hypothetical protein BWQ96_10332 [Gracilariopsis chorda]|uniref:Uncharacterized protein n=1 Tax=Gracilariopsis chorda TaxID=448386 RepID=A0A2V3IFL0_9FLOR|nr:hypothetical protein BWQ96_10332 [Gracilariopsis chorda]|eukprot:PXF39960.1 hypothetical protein BWQ96_10332 [Gracilariopsis chorda]